jgi:hypothetical protein
LEPSDRAVLRDLAKQYVWVAEDPIQDERRDLWRRHNSLQKTLPLIYVRAFAWREMPESKCVCEDPFFRQFESFFRTELFRSTFRDDFIFEPWVTLQATRKCSGWGVSPKRIRSDDPRGSFKVDYPIRKLEDIEKLRTPWHEIDEESTRRNAERLDEAIGDLIQINIDRGPAHRTWSADLSTDLGYLRGIENFMLDMMDNAEWFHGLLKFMSDGVLNAQNQAEDAGDWGLGAHQNQAMSYATELDDPAPNVNGIKREALWTFVAAQEYAVVSPAMHEEFLLRYQLPIMSRFGLASYGCCEDLTKKIDMLRQVPNLRRIAVAPVADVARCAEQIEQDYVLSYRPSPTDMVGHGFDENRIRSILREDLQACRDSHVDITLKDVETVQGDPNRVGKWVEITRQVIDEVFN